jgi:type IV pilus assembly protein PilC
MTICALVTLFLLTFVIPTFKNIFMSFSAELPWPTALLITVSDFLKGYWYLWVWQPIAYYWLFNWFHSTKGGRYFIDAKVLRAPIFGPILRKVAIAKFARTLGTLIRSGVPIMQALETVAGTSGNVVLEEAILKTRESIREGGRLADPLKASGLFPTMVTQMIKVGEETGSLDAMLAKIADFYDQEVDAAVKGLTSMIEPVIIVFMGLVVGSIVIAMFLPMFELGQLASKEG